MLVPCLYSRMRGVCKAVDPPDIKEYVEAMGVALHLINKRKLAKARANGTPWSGAMCADRTLIASATQAPPAISWLSLNAPPSAKWRILRSSNPTDRRLEWLTPQSIYEGLSHVSYLMSLNTGDWVVFPFADTEQLYPEDNRVQVEVDNILLLDELIR